VVSQKKSGGPFGAARSMCSCVSACYGRVRPSVDPK
jgi:hypothetical protein